MSGIVCGVKNPFREMTCELLAGHIAVPGQHEHKNGTISWCIIAEVPHMRGAADEMVFQLDERDGRCESCGQYHRLCTCEKP